MEDEEYLKYKLDKQLQEEQAEPSLEEVVSQVISGTYEEQGEPIDPVSKKIIIDMALSLLKNNNPSIIKVLCSTFDGKRSE